MYKKETDYLKSKLPECLIGKFNGFLAGGALTSIFTHGEIKDYDLYPRDEESFKDCISLLSKNSFYLKFLSSKSLTFINGDYIVQVIKYRYFKDESVIFKDFDFSVNMAAYDVLNDKMILSDNFLTSLSSREVSINRGTHYPLISMVRIKKYQEKGYTFKPTEIIKLAIRVTQVKIESWVDLEDQVGGIYGELCLTEKDPKEFSIAYAIDNFNRLFKYSNENENVNMDEFIEKTGITDKDWLRENEGNLFTGDYSNNELQF